MRYLGLDLGSRTLGIAISDNTGLIATSFKVIRHNEEYNKLIVEIKKIVEEEGIDEIVLGFPKNMNNTIGPKGELSLNFKEKLEKKLKIKVHLQDERLTTMEAEKKGIFTIVNDKGENLECEVLFTFDSDETNKSYIVYTDNTKDAKGNVQVYASTYNPEDDNSSLKPIETEKEWSVIETILNTLQEEIQKKVQEENN